MKLLNYVSVTALAAALAACGSGDIEVDARNQSTTDNSVGDNSNNQEVVGEGPSSPSTNPCASYEEDGETIQGNFDAPNCIYGSGFVSLGNPYTGSEELVFEDLDNDGVHIFIDSLMIGQPFDNDADMAAAGITQGGDGSVLRLEAGVTLAFSSDDDFFVINRGSQVFAEGERGAPVTVTSVSDVDGIVGPEDVREWGGMIINGFGVTNKCEYTGTRGVDIAGTECHVEAEGRAGAGQTFYGGTNDADNSGELNFFIVKHTGAEVSPGNDLNGISFNAIGSNTIVDHVQAYSTFDDGIEFFGGAVNVSNFVGLYVRDDSIDIDEGYIGTIDRALVIQSEGDGDHCIESDGIGSFSSQDQATIDDFIARGLNSEPTIRNLTCIISPNAGPDTADAPEGDRGTHAPGHGWRIREVHFPVIENAIVTSAFRADTDSEDNYCFRIDSTESLQAAQDGELQINESIFACSDMVVQGGGDLPDGTTQLEFIQASNDVMVTDVAGEDPTADDTDVNLAILDSFYSLPLGDMVVNGGAPTVTPTGGRDYLGGVTRDDDWTADWAYGLFEGNRGQPLWIDEQ